MVVVGVIEKRIKLQRGARSLHGLQPRAHDFFATTP